MSKPANKRKVIDCRLYPSEKNCSLAISGTEEEVLLTTVTQGPNTTESYSFDAVGNRLSSLNVPS